MQFFIFMHLSHSRSPSSSIFLLFSIRNKNLEEHIESINGDLKSTTVDLYATKEKLAYYQAESKNLHDEMTVVNQVKH